MISTPKGGSLNPRTNLRYGPPVKGRQRISKNILISGAATPHKFDVNVKAKYRQGEYVSAGYESTSGP